MVYTGQVNILKHKPSINTELTFPEQQPHISVVFFLQNKTKLCHSLDTIKLIAHVPPYYPFNCQTVSSILIEGKQNLDHHTWYDKVL